MDIELIILIIVAGIGFLLWFISLFSTNKPVGNWHKQNMLKHLNILSGLNGKAPEWWEKNKIYF